MGLAEAERRGTRGGLTRRGGVLAALLALCALLVHADRARSFTNDSGGWGFSAVILNGRVWTWGQNGYGQLGTGNTTWTTSPVQVPGLTNVTDLAAGADHVLARRSDGTVWAWGRNNYGQLGLGDTVDRASPVQVPGLTNIVAVGAGWYHSFAISASGQLYAWGRNDVGQLGLGDAVQRATPVAVPGMASVSQIAAGPHHTVAIMGDGTVRAWGFNGAGQLGVGDTANRFTPVQVPGLTGATSAGAGYGHSVVARSNGTVWAWGQNDWGQLGLGDTTNRLSPVQVPGITGVSMVDAGTYHTVARLSSGAVLAWGSNGYGQLGLGDTATRLTPVQVPGIAGVSLVSAGDRHTLAQRSDGTVWGWGGNDQGQLGLGDTANRLSPVQVPLDTVAPAVSWGAWSPGAISPNGDGVQEQASIAYTLSEPATVTVRVVDGAGTPVRTLVTSQAQSGTVPVTWNGRNGSNQPVPDGQYRLRLDAVDGAGNAAVLFSPWLAVDTTPPGITGLAAVPPAISPNGDGSQDTTALGFTLAEPAAATVQVKNASGQVVRTLWNAQQRPAGNQALAWDGKDGAGQVVPQGAYTVAVQARDAARNTATAQAVVTVDLAPPGVSGLAASPSSFSPNGDGVRDTTAIAFTLGEAAAATVQVKNASGQVVRTLWNAQQRPAGAQQVTWDGKDGAGQAVPQGVYTVAVQARDAAGNAGAAQAPVTVEPNTLELWAPAALAWGAQLTGFDLAAPDAEPVTVRDNTASGAGWRVLLRLTPLTGAGGVQLSGAALRVNGDPGSPLGTAAPGAACAAPGACTLPAGNPVAYPVTVTPGAPSPVRIYAAGSGSGKGAVALSPVFWLQVPAGAKAGTYSGTLTFSVASGP